MPAPRNNKNAAGKRIERERVSVSLSLSNGLLDLIGGYLLSQGIDPNAENVRQFTRDWFYLHVGDYLKGTIEIEDTMIAEKGAIIV
jgi:hypothetical protein